MSSPVALRPPPPQNDDFAAAAEITQLPVSLTVDASEATLELDEPICYDRLTRFGIASRPATTCASKRKRKTMSRLGRSALAVYQGTSVNALTLLACGKDLGGGYFAPGIVEFNATAGSTYYMRAAGSTRPPGIGIFITLDVEELIPPANDDRSDAQPLGSLPASVSGDTTNATIEPDEQRPCGGDTGSVWYSVTTATASDLWVNGPNARDL